MVQCRMAFQGAAGHCTGFALLCSGVIFYGIWLQQGNKRSIIARNRVIYKEVYQHTPIYDSLLKINSHVTEDELFPLTLFRAGSERFGIGRGIFFRPVPLRYRKPQIVATLGKRRLIVRWKTYNFRKKLCFGVRSILKSPEVTNNMVRNDLDLGQL